jgi:hypothetical protein
MFFSKIYAHEVFTFNRKEEGYVLIAYEVENKSGKGAILPTSDLLDKNVPEENWRNWRDQGGNIGRDRLQLVYVRVPAECKVEVRMHWLKVEEF